ncbi:hypothetical protein DF220_04000 [Salinibacterium hongtaonis]|uniref:Transglutaminase-like domain-containing protein n=1 Tax=Homoserinimonas hongtaonis TaxID=2079791 RepID=A0A2U1SZY0_9MICO|nr:hypothetical protein DF220_04000 [Salinibacterium hongtaonis]
MQGAVGVAHDEGVSRRPSPWAATGALFVALMAAMGALHVALEGSSWWFVCAGAAAAVLAASGGTRAALGAVSASRASVARPGRANRAIIALLPTLVGSVVAMILVPLFVVPSTTVLGLPTTRTGQALELLYPLGAESLSAQIPPAEVDEGVLAILVTGIAVMAVLLDALAISLRRPALAGIGLMVLAIAPSVVVRSAEFGWLLLTGLAWLWLLAAGRPLRGRRAWDAVAVGASAAVFALLVPLFAPVPSGSTATGSGGGEIRMGVNPIVGLGQDLRRPVVREALEYSTTSGTPRYLRLMALEGFDDSGWFHVPSPAEPLESGAVPPPPGLSDDVTRFVETTSITIRELGGLWVPMPYPAVGVEGFKAAATWDFDTVALRADRRSVRGEKFSVSSLSLDPTPQQLQDAGVAVPEPYQDLAQLDPSWPAVISETAASVTVDATTSYERALAIQDFLRNGDFLYSEKAPVREGYDGSSADVVGVFLAEGSGYCVHFASAMALMARSVGIPARVAVGFLPGEKSDETGFDEGETAWLVTSKELHAWPELYFDGIGWVPFEPTTGRGEVPDYAEPEALDDVAPADPSAAPVPSTRPSAAPTTPLAPAEALPGTGQAGPTNSSLSPWLLAIPVVVFLALVPALARLLVRAVQLSAVRRRRAESVVAWNEVVRSARDLGVPVEPATTPRQNAAILARQLGQQQPALDRLLDAVEREQFSRDDTGYPRAASDARSVIRGLRRSVSLRRRAIATLWPRSAIERIIRTIS